MATERLSIAPRVARQGAAGAGEQARVGAWFGELGVSFPWRRWVQTASTSPTQTPSPDRGAQPNGRAGVPAAALRGAAPLLSAPSRLPNPSSPLPHSNVPPRLRCPAGRTCQSASCPSVHVIAFMPCPRTHPPHKNKPPSDRGAQPHGCARVPAAAVHGARDRGPHQRSVWDADLRPDPPPGPPAVVPRALRAVRRHRWVVV